MARQSTSPDIQTTVSIQNTMKSIPSVILVLATATGLFGLPAPTARPQVRIPGTIPASTTLAGSGENSPDLRIPGTGYTPLTIQIQNNGDQDTTISAIGLNTPVFYTPIKPVTIPAGKSAPIQIIANSDGIVVPSQLSLFLKTSTAKGAEIQFVRCTITSTETLNFNTRVVQWTVGGPAQKQTINFIHIPDGLKVLSASCSSPDFAVDITEDGKALEVTPTSTKAETRANITLSVTPDTKRQYMLFAQVIHPFPVQIQQAPTQSQAAPSVPAR